MRCDGASADDADALLWSRGRCSRRGLCSLLGAPFVCQSLVTGGAPKGWRGLPGGAPFCCSSGSSCLGVVGAPKAAVLAPRGAEAPLGLRACLGHRGRSAGSRSAVAFLLFAAVRAWRSSQAFPVKRRGPRLARVAGCRVLRGFSRVAGWRLWGAAHKICFRDCRRARLFLAGAAPRG